MNGEPAAEHFADDFQAILSAGQVALVGDQHCADRLDRGIGVLGRPLACQQGFRLGQSFQNGFGCERRVVISQVEHQDCGVGRTDHARDVRFEKIRRDGGKIDQLHAHVFPFHHAGLRLARRKWIGGHVRCGPSQPAEQTTLAGVGASEQDILSCSLLGYFVADADFLGVLLFLLDFFAQIAHARFQIGLHFLAGFVLGQKREHALEAFQPLFGGLGLLEIGFCFEVLRS